jgi:hypothetical protein
MIIAIITQIKFHSPPASPIESIWTLRNNKVVYISSVLLAILCNLMSWLSLIIQSQFKMKIMKRMGW